MRCCHPPFKGGVSRRRTGGCFLENGPSRPQKWLASPLNRGAPTAALFFFLVVSFIAWAVDVPPLKARVTDLSGTLNAQQRAALEQSLAEFEARKGAQIAVLMLPTTQPETIEDRKSTRLNSITCQSRMPSSA